MTRFMRSSLKKSFCHGHSELHLELRKHHSENCFSLGGGGGLVAFSLWQWHLSRRPMEDLGETFWVEPIFKSSYVFLAEFLEKFSLAKFENNMSSSQKVMLEMAICWG